MRTLFMTADGRLISEKTKLSTKLIEMVDGYHPVSPQAVWFDEENRDEPLMVFASGRIAPLGQDLGLQEIYKIQGECEIIKRCHRRQSVSKRWMRALLRIIDFITEQGIWMAVVLLVIGSIVYSFLGA